MKTLSTIQISSYFKRAKNSRKEAFFKAIHRIFHYLYNLFLLKKEIIIFLI
jgi:hypothetical protein